MLIEYFFKSTSCFEIYSSVIWMIEPGLLRTLCFILIKKFLPTSCFEIYSSVIWMLCRTYLIPTVCLMLINDQFCCLISTEAQLISLDDLVLCAAHEAEVQRMPRLNQPLQSDGDPAGASDHSDVGPASPAKQSNSSQSGTPQRSSSQSGTPQRSSSQSGTPQRSSHLSIPSAVASSHTGSIDEVVS